MAKKTEDKCSFCGRSRNEVQFLIAGLDALICEDCTKQANRIISEDAEVKTSTPLNKLVLLKPAQIKAHLDEYVIGQDEAKKVLSVAVYKDRKSVV